MPIKMRTLAILLSALLPAAALAPAAEGPAPAAEKPKDVIIKTLPGIVIDTKAREVRLDSTVCLAKGALELFVCSQGTREHESVLVVKAKPSHVVFALSMLGLEPGKPGFVTEGGAYSPPAGEVLDIAARWTCQGKAVEMPAWKLLRLSGMEEGLDRAIDWVCVGRPEAEALRAADREGSVVCLSNFTEAVIDVPFESTSVNAGLIYEANPDAIPPVGTPVELIIKPAGKRIDPVKVEIRVTLRKGKPVELDGKAMTTGEFTDAVNATPASIRTTVLEAEPEETFSRVMEVHEILRNALMQVHLKVMRPEPPAPVIPAAPAVTVTVTADDKIHVGDQAMDLAAFKAKAGELLKGNDAASLAIYRKSTLRTVAEVLAIMRDMGLRVHITRVDE